MEKDLMIPRYIFEKSQVNGFYFYKYLHIRGGAGFKIGHDKNTRHRTGGEYDLILFYALPEEMKDKPAEMCDMKWCEEKGIVFGEGKTIEESYSDYQNKVHQQSTV